MRVQGRDLSRPLQIRKNVSKICFTLQLKPGKLEVIAEYRFHRECYEAWRAASSRRRLQGIALPVTIRIPRYRDASRVSVLASRSRAALIVPGERTSTTSSGAECNFPSGWNALAKRSRLIQNHIWRNIVISSKNLLLALNSIPAFV